MADIEQKVLSKVNTDIQESTTRPIIILLSSVCILIGSMFAAKKNQKNGIVNGGVVGGIYLLVLWILSSIFIDGMGFTMQTAIMLLAAILINSKAADFIVTGCGTGEGAMLALNSFPNVICGHIEDAEDAYMFGQINDGNAVAIPFAKGFGWGGELTLEYIFEKLFKEEFGGGYPKERAIPEQNNKRILDDIKKVTYKDMVTILRDIDQDFLYQTINTKEFKEKFFKYAEDGEIKNIIKNVLDK